MPKGVYTRTDEMRRHMSLVKIGKPIHTEESKAKLRAAFSGEKCHFWKGGKPKCINCGKRLASVYAKLCQRCFHKIHTEKNHWNWKGGRSKAYKTGYYSADYKKWRMAIFQRDGFMCQNCNKIGGDLEAHHIKSFTYYPKLRLDINNGITLCRECHKLTFNSNKR